jgi:hypothetical protein
MVRYIPVAPLVYQKRFPKAFTAIIIIRKDGYPEYRYRNNGRIFTVCKPGFPGQEVIRNNRWIVPYNPYLFQKFRSHINIKVCISIQAIKYIYKYIYKGTDRITVAISGTNDEITQYLQARYIGPIEAFWYLFEYPIYQEFLPVQYLAIHLPG